MIDLESETVVSLNEATKHLPRRRRGKRPHVSTLHRWMTAGVRGIKLEAIYVGATRCTSLEAIQRFCERVTADTTGTPVCTSKQRQREIHKAEAELQAAGIG